MPRSHNSFLPAAAVVVAVLALVAALGGTSYAAAKISGSAIAKGTVKGKALKDKTITGDKIADNTLTGAQINEATLGQVPSAATAGSAAPSGPAAGALQGTYPNPTLKDGVVGASAMGTLNDRTAVVTIAANATGNASVQCQPGEQVISGGNDAGSISTPFIVASRRAGNGWGVFANNTTASSVSLTVHAYCLTP